MKNRIKAQAEFNSEISRRVSPIKQIILGLLGIGLVACQSSESSAPSTPAFYHWKVAYNPTRSEVDQLRELNIQKQYIHFFDVDWDARTRQPVPKAVVQFRQKPTGAVVPVVFITNRTISNLTPAALSDLARYITQGVTRLRDQNQLTVSEVQFDCDWSAGTRDRYFQLLTLLKKGITQPLSATIRLHQIKYTDQMGIPPVARGMLMLYNVADWKRADTRNSIYDADVADPYLSFLETYPLPLDLVMPIFHWTVVYRNNRFLTFLNNLDRKTLVKSDFLTVQADSMRFIANRDTTAFGFSVRRGDLFRAEAITSETLLTEKNRVMKEMKKQPLTFALFHLDSTTLAAYPHETLQRLIQPESLP